MKSIAAVTPKHHVAAKIEQAIGIEKILQELSESINACVQVQKEKNRRFWTYLVHLKAQKHQFARYCSSLIFRELGRLLQQKKVKK